MYFALSHVYFRRQKFTFSDVGTKNSGAKTGAREWSGFMAPVFGTCVMAVKLHNTVLLNYVKRINTATVTVVFTDREFSTLSLKIQ